MSTDTDIESKGLRENVSPELQEEMSEAADMMEARRLHPVTLLQRVIVSIPALFVLLIPVIFGTGEEGTGTWLFFAAMYVAIAFPVFVMQYLRFSYWLTPKEIVIQSGVIKRNNRSIPIERVQNIQIIQGVIPRLFGTAKVKIETAGSATTEGMLEYVKVSEAQRLRKAVRAFQREKGVERGAKVADQPEGAPDVAPEAPPAEPERQLLYRMPFSRVLLSGMFRFSLLFIALIFSVLSYIPDFETVLFEWLEQGQLQWVADAAAESIVLTVLVTIFVAAILAWITGALLNINRYYGFELWLEEDKLYRKHGLLTHSEGNIPLEKVQALVFRSNPIMRKFGWFIFELQTMGVDRDEQGHQVAIPFAQLDEIKEISQHIRTVDVPEEFESVSMHHMRRLFIRYGVVLAIATALVAHFLWSPAWWIFTLVPLLAIYCYFRYRHHGYATSDEYFFVRSGVFRYHIWILPTEKHQVFYNSSSIFQRRLGLKSLAVDTAGAGGMAFPDVRDLPQDVADHLLDKLYANFYSYFEHAAPPDHPQSKQLS